MWVKYIDDGMENTSKLLPERKFKRNKTTIKSISMSMQMTQLYIEILGCCSLEVRWHNNQQFQSNKKKNQNTHKHTLFMKYFENNNVDMKKIFVRNIFVSLRVYAVLSCTNILRVWKKRERRKRYKQAFYNV